MWKPTCPLTSAAVKSLEGGGVGVNIESGLGLRQKLEGIGVGRTKFPPPKYRQTRGGR